MIGFGDSAKYIAHIFHPTSVSGGVRGATLEVESPHNIDMILFIILTMKKPSRRSFLATVATVGLAGCSAQSSSRPIGIIAYTSSENQHRLHLTIEKKDEVLVEQELIVPADRPNYDPVFTTIKGLVVSKGDRLNVTGKLEGSNQTSNTPLTIDCPKKYDTDLLGVRISHTEDPTLSDSCYTKDRWQLRDFTALHRPPLAARRNRLSSSCTSRA